MRFDRPNLGLGLGLRTTHFGHITGKYPAVDWFEIVSENFMDTRGRPRMILERIAEKYPITLHGVSMNIGSTDPVDRAYHRSLRRLADEFKPKWVSDHFCWTGVGGRNLHDLLPLPYTEEALRHVVDRVKQVQDILGRPLVLENPSSYVEFRISTMPEWEFISRVAEASDCGLLLDVNNVYVSSYNHGFNPNKYIDAIPHDRVAYYHIAGHTNLGTHIIDTHGGRVIHPVWKLYERSVAIGGPRSTCLEWDTDIPKFDVVHREVLKSRKFIERTERQYV